MKRNKIVAVILVVIICLFGSFGCGAKNDVKNALQGSWTAKWTVYGQQISRYYTFKGYTYTTGGEAYLGTLDTETGTYEIKDSVIHLIPDDGSVGNDLEYTYNKTTGTITLWWNDDIQFQKGQLNVVY